MQVSILRTVKAAVATSVHQSRISNLTNLKRLTCPALYSDLRHQKAYISVIWLEFFHDYIYRVLSQEQWMIRTNYTHLYAREILSV
jgi:hypothetical protein